MIKKKREEEKNGKKMHRRRKGEIICVMGNRNHNE